MYRPQFALILLGIAVTVYLLHIQYTHQGSDSTPTPFSSAKMAQQPQPQRLKAGLSLQEYEDMLVGKPYISPDTRPPHAGAYIAHWQLPPGTRLLPYGTMATMDFRPNRLNIQLDKDETIASVRFG